MSCFEHSLLSPFRLVLFGKRVRIIPLTHTNFIISCGGGFDQPRKHPKPSHIPPRTLYPNATAEMLAGQNCTLYKSQPEFPFCVPVQDNVYGMPSTHTSFWEADQTSLSLGPSATALPVSTATQIAVCDGWSRGGGLTDIWRAVAYWLAVNRCRKLLHQFVRGIHDFSVSMAIVSG